MILTDWVYWNSFSDVGSHCDRTIKKTLRDCSALPEDVVLVISSWFKQ